MSLTFIRPLVLTILGLVVATSSAFAEDARPLLKTLASENHFALVRHALAPGNGDPHDFDVTDCSTQRNLNDTGRSQARNIGQTLKDNGIVQASVYTSQWCRCQDTAQLLGFNSVETNPVPNSFYQQQENRQKQTDELEQWLVSMHLTEPVIMVTHQVNITAFTGVYPSSGDMVIVKRNEDATFTVVGVVSTEQ